MGNFVVDPTPTEIASNARDYQVKIRKIEKLTEELVRLKKTLRCCYCGAPHYSGGYCASCYVRVKAGKPLKRRSTRTAEKGRAFARNSCYRKIYGTLPAPEIDLNEFARMVVEAAPDDQSRKIAQLYLLDGYTAERIGVVFSKTKQWAGQRIDWLCRFVRKAVNNK